MTTPLHKQPQPISAQMSKNIQSKLSTSTPTIISLISDVKKEEKGVRTIYN
jgi:hypothetical protein